jgi:hypothetical protein
MYLMITLCQMVVVDNLVVVHLLVAGHLSNDNMIIYYI